MIARRDREAAAAEEREQAAPAPAAAAPVTAPPQSPQQVLALQGQIGNAAVGRMLQRHEDHDGETAVAEPQQAAPGAPAAAKVPGQAAAEADAAETVDADRQGDRRDGQDERQPDGEEHRAAPPRPLAARDASRR